MKVEVIAYDPCWPAAFAAERLALVTALGKTVAEVHHIGSTSVVGLAAKPIIDIILEVDSLERLDEKTPEMEVLGYEAMGEFGMPGRRYFRKGGKNRTHHVHAFLVGDANVIRHLAFRDYLTAYPQAAVEYAQLKKRLAISCADDWEAYCDGKDDFMKHHEALAIAWRDRSPGSAQDFTSL